MEPREPAPTKGPMVTGPHGPARPPKSIALSQQRRQRLSGLASARGQGRGKARRAQVMQLEARPGHSCSGHILREKGKGRQSEGHGWTSLVRQTGGSCPSRSLGPPHLPPSPRPWLPSDLPRSETPSVQSPTSGQWDVRASEKRPESAGFALPAREAGPAGGPAEQSEGSRREGWGPGGRAKQTGPLPPAQPPRGEPTQRPCTAWS